MSEFKFACPVCGQHMMCDSSHGGSVMECPTCFQKIIAPQAPATNDPKFILTGTKLGERPTVTVAADPMVAVQKTPVLGIVLTLFLVLALAGVGFAYVLAKRQKASSVENPSVAAATTETSKPVSAVAPAVPVDDTNWILNLDGVATPDAPALGRVHGEAATLDRAIFQGGTLTFRPSVRGAADVSVAISFNGALPTALAGQTINVATNADKAARVTLHWKEDGQNKRATFGNGYALRLEFGDLADNRLPGKIYLAVPDAEKSYVTGTFNAEIRRPKPKKN